jgi:preprotein translocase subunit Sec61beta
MIALRIAHVFTGADNSMHIIPVYCHHNLDQQTQGAPVRANHHNRHTIRWIPAGIVRFFQSERMKQPKNVEVGKVMLSPSPANPRF